MTEWPIPKTVAEEIHRFFCSNRDKIKCVRFGTARDKDDTLIHRFVFIIKENTFDRELFDEVAALKERINKLWDDHVDCLHIPGSCEEDIGAILETEYRDETKDICE